MNIARVLSFLGAVYFASCQWYDFTGKHQRWTILSLGQELVGDAKMKIKQTVDIRKEHSRFLAYEIGYLIGKIREKYKLMMEYYRICYNRFTEQFNLATPKIAGYIAVYYFRKQELVLLLAMEIDKLVEVLERMNMDVVPFPVHLEGHHLRTRDDSSDSEDEKQRELEEAVKSRYREEFLMRKLNSSGQSTSRKRFLNKWPVPGTWSLETY